LHDVPGSDLNHIPAIRGVETFEGITELRRCAENADGRRYAALVILKRGSAQKAGRSSRHVRFAPWRARPEQILLHRILLNVGA
jgi:hypothetical protein